MPSPEEDRTAVVAATARHIHTVVSVLRELDLGDTPPPRPSAPTRRGCAVRPYELSLAAAADAIRDRRLSRSTWWTRCWNAPGRCSRGWART